VVQRRLQPAVPVYQAAEPIEQSRSESLADARLAVDGVATTRFPQELRAVKIGDIVVQELIVHGISSFAA